MLADRIEARHILAFVAIVDGEIIGFVSGADQFLRPWRSGHFLGVGETFKGCGIAPLLIDRFIMTNRRPLVRFFVGSHNIGAKQLFERLGFRPVSVRKNHYDNGDDAIAMMVSTSRYKQIYRPDFLK